MEQKAEAPSNGPASKRIIDPLSPGNDLPHMGVETGCLMYSVHCTVVARSSFAASWGQATWMW